MLVVSDISSSVCVVDTSGLHVSCVASASTLSPTIFEQQVLGLGIPFDLMSEEGVVWCPWLAWLLRLTQSFLARQEFVAGLVRETESSRCGASEMHVLEQQDNGQPIEIPSATTDLMSQKLTKNPPDTDLGAKCSAGGATGGHGQQRNCTRQQCWSSAK